MHRGGSVGPAGSVLGSRLWHPAADASGVPIAAPDGTPADNCECCGVIADPCGNCPGPTPATLTLTISSINFSGCNTPLCHAAPLPQHLCFIPDPPTQSNFESVEYVQSGQNGTFVVAQNAGNPCQWGPIEVGACDQFNYCGDTQGACAGSRRFGGSGSNFVYVFRVSGRWDVEHTGSVLLAGTAKIFSANCQTGGTAPFDALCAGPGLVTLVPNF